MTDSESERALEAADRRRLEQAHGPHPDLVLAAEPGHAQADGLRMQQMLPPHPNQRKMVGPSA